MYCSQCGTELNDKAVICVKCGCAVGDTESLTQRRQFGNFNSEWLTTVLLCLLLGALGIHRFYTKNNDIAVLQLILGILTCGIVSVIWAIIDFILLVTGGYKTGDGRILKNG